MLRIIHIVVDDKFIDGMIEIFDNIDYIKCRYLINKKNANYIYIRQKRRIENLTEKEILEELNKIKEYDVLIMHSLSSNLLTTIAGIDSSIRVIWFPWGWDIYQTSQLGKGIKNLVNIEQYSSLTYALLKKKQFNKKGYLKIIILYLKDILTLKTTINQALLIKVIKRIDYCATVIPLEYDMLKKSCPFFNAEQIYFNYKTPLSKFIYMNKVKGNILIGNSATASNNHLDVFNYLSNLSLEDRKIIIPLNYGDKKYASTIQNIAIKQFGENTFILNNYISYDDYYSMIGKCSHAIFYHKRQQAVGNIIISIANGLKVYMSKESCVFKFLTDLGVKLFTVENDITQESISEEIPYDIAFQNYKIIADYFSNSSIVFRLKASLCTIERNRNML